MDLNPLFLCEFVFPRLCPCLVLWYYLSLSNIFDYLCDSHFSIMDLNLLEFHISQSLKVVSLVFS